MSGEGWGRHGLGRCHQTQVGEIGAVTIPKAAFTVASPELVFRRIFDKPIYSLAARETEHDALARASPTIPRLGSTAQSCLGKPDKVVDITVADAEPVIIVLVQASVEIDLIDLEDIGGSVVELGAAADCGHDFIERREAQVSIDTDTQGKGDPKHDGRHGQKLLDIAHGPRVVDTDQEHAAQEQ